MAKRILMRYPFLLFPFYCILSWVAFFALSALDQLTTSGYIVFFSFSALLLMRLKIPQAIKTRHTCFSRFSYPPALVWLAVAFLILIGSLWHLPSNYDAYSYRIPRMLHWLAEGHWYWINGPDSRYDFMAAMWEITALPILAITGTDRFLFLPNFFCFLMLPGATFSLMRLLGAGRCISRLTMWVAPTGYGFILQSGSLGSDLLGATLFLISLVYLCKWLRNSHSLFLFISALALGFSTATKVSNIAFGLPWLLLLAPSLPKLFQKPALLFGTALCGALFSYLPFAAWNLSHGSGFAGDASSSAGKAGGPLLVSLAGNSIIWPAQNFAPPVFPIAARVQGIVEGAIPQPFLSSLKTQFEGAFKLGVGEIVTEDAAGLGFGTTLFACLLLLAKFFPQGPPLSCPTPRHLPFLLSIGMFLSIGAFFLSTSMISISRILMPAYLPVIALLGIGRATDAAAKSRIFVGFAILLQLTAVVVLLLNPARPLLPVPGIASCFLPQESPLLKRIDTVYLAYGQRSRALTPIVESLGSGTTEIAFVAKADTLETGLWVPFGSRRILPIKAADAVRPGFDFPTAFVIAQERGIRQDGKVEFEEFLSITNLRIIKEFSLLQQASQGPERFFLLSTSLDATPANN